MGGCLAKAPALGGAGLWDGPSPRPALVGPKRYDVFVSHHQGVRTGGAADFSEQFAGWIAELCTSMGLQVFIDKTNLSRIVDERGLKETVAASRVVVGVVSREALVDPHGMQEELWWAHSAGVPIVPFYDADHHSVDEYGAWKKEFPFALQRTPVVYQRRKHLKTKDVLTGAVLDALLEAYQGKLPDFVAETATKRAERLRRREARAAAQAGGHAAKRQQRAPGKEGAAAAGAGEDSAWRPPPRPTEEPDSRPQRTADRGGLKRPPPQTLRRPSDGSDSAAPGSESARSGRADKRFRFRDDDVVTDGDLGGVGRILKSLRDPLGRKEQELRAMALTGGGGEDEGEVRYEPRHLTLRPAKGILKGGLTAPRGPQVPAHQGTTAQLSLDPRVQKGLSRLSDYLDTVSKSDVGQLPTVIRVLQLMVPNREIATKALAVVFDFVRDAAKCRQVVAQQGGIKDIVSAMAAHTQSIDLQTYGCGCLFALSCFRPDNPEKDNNSAAIAHAGGIGRIIEAMEKYPTCREIQQWGAGALRHLAVEIGANRREVSEGGEVQLTMRGINKRMIAKIGGLELIVKAMLKFPDDLEIQENGCGALCNLLSNRQDTKVRAARAGCIRAAVAALKVFSDDPELAQLACALLRGLALGMPENKIAIVAQGGVRQLCQAMAKHRAEAEVNAQAVAALCNLTSQVAENKRAICEAGGLELSIAAMRAHPANEELQRQGCGLLHNLACERPLRAQVIAAGGVQIAEAATKHTARAVQQLGQLLKRQLQEGAAAGPSGGEAGGANAAGTGAAGEGADEGGDGGVDGLFAPRRPGSGSPGTGSARAGAAAAGAAAAVAGGSRGKALTRPQRKVMADVLESMRQDPGGWLPADSEDDSNEGSTESTRGVRRKGTGAAGGRAGGWDTRREAAAYGIEDLEGLSDISAAPPRGGAFDFIVKRGMAQQGSSPQSGSAGRPASASPAGPDYIVRRGGRRRGADDEASETASEASSAASGSGRRPDGAEPPASAGPDYVVRRGTRPKRSEDEMSEAASEASGPSSPSRVRPPAPPGAGGPPPAYTGRQGQPTGSPSSRQEGGGPTTAAGAGAAAAAGVQQGGPPQPVGRTASAAGQQQAGQNRSRSKDAASEAPAEEGRRPSGGVPAAPAGLSSPARRPSAASSQQQGASAALAQAGTRDLDAMSQASSEQSEGGWIDLFEDGDVAGRRLQRRARRDERRDARDAAKAGDRGEGEAAAMLRELLGEVELEELPPPPPPVGPKRTRSKKRFASALHRCGDAPPELYEESWKEVLRLRYEEGQKSVAQRGAKAIASTSGDAAAALLHSLDGLTAKVVGERPFLAADKARQQVAETARRIRDEGLVSVVQNSSMSRRLRYGLDDDEDSIYGMDELQELGAAEAALLDALADDLAANEANAGGDAEASSQGTSALPPELGAARLQSLSAKLDRKREERRRVKML